MKNRDIIGYLWIKHNMYMYTYAVCLYLLSMGYMMDIYE